MQIKDLKDCQAYLPILASWHHEEWSYLNPEKSLERRIKDMDAYLYDDLIPSTWVAIGEHEQPMGSAAIRSYDMDTHMHLSPWLVSVFVDPNHRRNGIGAQLVRHVMSMASASLIERLYLFTPDQADFYANLGWQHLESCNYHGTDVTIMYFECQQSNP